MREQRTSRPRHVAVWYRGIPYVLDLVACRRALVKRQVEGRFDRMESLAGAIGASRSTVSRFFSGRPTSLGVTLRLLDALGLEFDEVAGPMVDGDDAEGAAGASVSVRPAPRGPQPGLPSMAL